MALWHPSTCNCILEFSNFSNDPNKFVKALYACPRHCDVLNLLEVVMTENQCLNQVVGRVIELVPEVTMDIPDAFGGVAKVLDPLKAQVKYNDKKELNVYVQTGLTDSNKESIKSCLQNYVPSFTTIPKPIIKFT